MKVLQLLCGTISNMWVYITPEHSPDHCNSGTSVWTTIIKKSSTNFLPAGTEIYLGKHKGVAKWNCWTCCCCSHGSSLLRLDLTLYREYWQFSNAGAFHWVGGGIVCLFSGSEKFFLLKNSVTWTSSLIGVSWSCLQGICLHSSCMDVQIFMLLASQLCFHL